jgi:hypothetical protein
VRGAPRHLAFATVVSLLASWPATALADKPARLPLEWSAEGNCPDRAAAESSILDMLGQRVPSEASADLVRVEIMSLPNGRWSATITTRGESGSGQRRLEGSTCERVAEAAILIVAMTLDAEKVVQEVKTKRAAAKNATITEAQPVPVASTAEAQPAPIDRPRALLGVQVPADVGSLPGPTIGLGVVFGMEAWRVHVEGQGTFWAPRVALTGPTAGSGGEIGLFTAGVQGCVDAVVASAGEIRLGPCLGAEAGVTTGTSVGINPAVQRRGTWVAGLGGLSLRRTAASGLSYGVLAELGVPVRRPAFVIDHFGPVFQASPAVLRMSLNLAWIFP